MGALYSGTFNTGGSKGITPPLNSGFSCTSGVPFSDTTGTSASEISFTGASFGISYSYVP